MRGLCERALLNVCSAIFYFYPATSVHVFFASLTFLSVRPLCVMCMRLSNLCSGGSLANERDLAEMY